MKLKIPNLKLIRTPARWLIFICKQ